tara:strand:+ start:20866 stop:21276 length:411 start_codon:yes stop_codon:yes gene_type:complete
MPKLLANIKDNKLYLDQDYESYEALKELEGKRVEVTIKLWRNTLTRRQQKYYRGALLPFSVKVFNDAGIMIIDDDEMHEVYKKAFWSREVVWGDTTKVISKSTTKMTTKEKTVFMEKIKEFLRDNYNAIVPEPKEE